MFMMYIHHCKRIDKSGGEHPSAPGTGQQSQLDQPEAAQRMRSQIRRGSPQRGWQPLHLRHDIVIDDHHAECLRGGNVGLGQHSGRRNRLAGSSCPPKQ